MKVRIVWALLERKMCGMKPLNGINGIRPRLSRPLEVLHILVMNNALGSPWR